MIIQADQETCKLLELKKRKLQEAYEYTMKVLRYAPVPHGTNAGKEMCGILHSYRSQIKRKARYER